jgi:uncharacterized protein YjiS (DUF1127 family)
MDVMNTVAQPARIEADARPAIAWPIIAGIAAATRLFLAALERSRQRRALAALNDRLLQDIGLTREEFVRRTSSYQPRP